MSACARPLPVAPRRIEDTMRIYMLIGPGGARTPAIWSAGRKHAPATGQIAADIELRACGEGWPACARWSSPMAAVLLVGRALTERT